MDEALRRHVPVILSMVKSGAALDEIPGIIGVTQREWEEIKASPGFMAAVESHFAAGDAPMTSEEVLQRATRMTADALETVERTMTDARASSNARLKAAETALQWREELNNKKAEAAHRIVYHLHVDPRALKRMQDMIDMFMADEGKSWLQEVAQIMPNSTA